MTNRRTFIKTSSPPADGVALASTMPMAACKGANERIFLFFPEDVRRPSITTGDSVLIKKIVSKVVVE
jgi:hypothetical protein